MKSRWLDDWMIGWFDVCIKWWDDWNLCKTAHLQVACMKWIWGKSSTGGSNLAALPDGEDSDDHCNVLLMIMVMKMTIKIMMVVNRKIYERTIQFGKFTCRNSRWDQENIQSGKTRNNTALGKRKHSQHNSESFSLFDRLGVKIRFHELRLLSSCPKVITNHGWTSS